MKTKFSPIIEALNRGWSYSGRHRAFHVNNKIIIRSEGQDVEGMPMTVVLALAALGEAVE